MQFGETLLDVRSYGQDEEERREQVLTREVLAHDTTGGIKLVTTGTGLNVFDTMGLESVVTGRGQTALSDVSNLPPSAVSMAGSPSGTFASIGASASGTGPGSSKGSTIFGGFVQSADGRLNAHKAALKIRETRTKKGKGSRGAITDSANVDVNVRLFIKAIRPCIEDFHAKHAYEHTRQGRKEIAERQQREAAEAIRELDMFMGLNI